jgi:hypothetical protein
MGLHPSVHGLQKQAILGCESLSVFWPEGVLRLRAPAAKLPGFALRSGVTVFVCLVRERVPRVTRWKP